MKKKNNFYFKNNFNSEENINNYCANGYHKKRGNL